MRLVIIAHARDRMALRGITEEMVKGCLEKPDVKSRGYKDRRVHYKKYGGQYISVVFEIEKTARRVITVIWKDKPLP